MASYPTTDPRGPSGGAKFTGECKSQHLPALSAVLSDTIRSICPTVTIGLSLRIPKDPPPSTSNKEPTPKTRFRASSRLNEPHPDVVPLLKFLTSSAVCFSLLSQAYCILLPTMGFIAFPVAQTTFPEMCFCPSKCSLHLKRSPTRQSVRNGFVSLSNFLSKTRLSPQTFPSRPSNIHPMSPPGNCL